MHLVVLREPFALQSARAQRIVLLRSVFMERDSAVARRCPERLSWSGARNTQFYTLRFDLSDVVMGKFSSDTYFTSRLRLARSEHVAYLSGLRRENDRINTFCATEMP